MPARHQLHKLLCDALAAMPTVYEDRTLTHLDGDEWHLAEQVTDGDGVADLPAHSVHMGFAVEFGRAKRTSTAQRRGDPALAELSGTVYLAFDLRSNDLAVEDYRDAMAAAELAAHTIEGPWHGGAAVVDIEEDWSPRHPEGEPVLVTTITFRLRHERSV